MSTGIIERCEGDAEVGTLPHEHTSQAMHRHGRWADGDMLVRFFLTTVVSAAVWFLLEEGRFDAVEEIPAFTLLSIVMLGICIRQGAGMIAVRIELAREAE
jgi:hypothetical protein